MAGKPPRVKFRKISWRAIVEKLDPKRHDRKTEYQFSNGRKFKEK